MRILQVITDTDRRGAQVFAMDLGAAIARRGHDVITVALAPGVHRPALDVRVLGVRARGLGTIRSLRREMGLADITIAHGSSTGLACALTGRRFVYRQISDTRFWAGTWQRRARVALYLRRATRVVALSVGAKRDLIDHLRLPAGRIDVVPNGIPTAGFGPASERQRAEALALLGVSAEKVVALYIGALAPEKGADLAIGALARIADAVLLVVGDGPERDRLRSLADVDRPVHFLGAVERVVDVYAASDIVLLPSRGGDSMPATLIEAGCCALPCISTDVGSITDVVVDGVTGIIVPVDDVEALSLAVQGLADDAERRGALGRAAREYCVSHFDIEVVASSWLTTLEAARQG